MTPSPPTATQPSPLEPDSRSLALLRDPGSDSAKGRPPLCVKSQHDFVVVGGGLAGVCAAVQASRAGLQVALIQDRPVLGGNASSEVRLWALGATSHLGNNNRWAREGGVIDEIMTENLWRNREGNPVIFDTVLLEKVTAEPNITLLLNTQVLECEKSAGDRISKVRGFCSQNSTCYVLSAPLFCDASGDGILGFTAGAPFRIGQEARTEFAEGMAPEKENRDLLGDSIFFYSKEVGHPVRFVPPAFALKDLSKIRNRQTRPFHARTIGSQLWWIEYGGHLDTVHEAETIKWELWRIVYGVWNHIKNSGEYPDAANLTLEWIGTVPGKRESRRFEGDYMMIQQDIVEQRTHQDAVAFGGWAIDHHPTEGVYSEQAPCVQWHAKGVYQIPYRALYSRSIRNLFLAGRCISASHIAFGSTRVMVTCAHTAQAVGEAAALCLAMKLDPAGIASGETIRALQTRLQRKGQYIPDVPRRDDADLARTATITASSEYILANLPIDHLWQRLENSVAMLIPVAAGTVPKITFYVQADAATSLQIELRASLRLGNYTPDKTLGQKTIALAAGEQEVAFDFTVKLDHSQYLFFCLMANSAVSVRTSESRVTGLLSVTNKFNPAVATTSTQEPPANSGIDRFEFWCPERRPGGRNLALRCEPALKVFSPKQVANGWSRPTTQTNAWVAAPTDALPTLSLTWAQPQSIHEVCIAFDPDWDHPLETVLMGHPEDVVPFCVRHFRLRNGDDAVLHEVTDNHQTLAVIHLPQPVTTQQLTLEIVATHGTPAAIFEVMCFS